MEENRDKKNRKGERIDPRFDNDMRKVMYQAHYQNGVKKVTLPHSHSSWNNNVRPEQSRDLSTQFTSPQQSRLYGSDK